VNIPFLPQLAAVAAISLLTVTPHLRAQQVPFERLPTETFDVTPPSARVAGGPGQMQVIGAACRSLPTAEVRRRIVNVAVQEWGFFGFPIDDQTVERDNGETRSTRRAGFRRQGNPEENRRVAASIAGYWSATPDGSWMVERQNDNWNGSRGLTSRWRDPWSAAFISWVMCESGLGDSDQFRRNIAHHVYIDQAIRARDSNDASAAFVAYDPGEVDVEPGDMLCSASRPAYNSISERRRQMGDGARMHCDVVVKVDAASQRILTVGGNVGGRVSLKIMRAVPDGDVLRADGRRGLFAHLKLRADSIEVSALDSTPTMKALGMSAGILSPNQITARHLASEASISE